MTQKGNREYRTLQITPVLESDKQMVEGYAAVVETPTVLCQIDGIDYREVIDKHAFDTADLSDVPLKYNHDDSALILARTRNKTLQLSVDERGLKIIADIAKTSYGKDIYTLIQRGDLDKMSFGFTVKEDSYDAPTHTRRILRFDKIFDVSIVDLPAYDATEIYARNYFQAKAEIEKKMEEEQRRKRLMLLTY